MRSNQRGFSMVQVLVAIGVSGVLAMAIATMMSNQNKDAKALTEKLAGLDLTNQLLTVWADPAICTGQLTGVTFNSSKIGTPNPPVINLTSIAGPAGTSIVTAGGPVSPVAPGFNVSTIKVTQLAGSGDDFTAYLQVDFQNSAHGKSHKPIMARLKIRTDPATPPASKAITACSGSNGTITSTTAYFECMAPRKSSCSVSSSPGMKLCALTKVDNHGCNTCAFLNCNVTGPDATGVFTLHGVRGDDPDSYCGMTCIQ